jgi:hypothetical protein
MSHPNPVAGTQGAIRLLSQSMYAQPATSTIFGFRTFAVGHS